jgi:hypothetical protein
MLIALCACIPVACRSSQSEPETGVNAEIDLPAFIELARNSSCADIRNRLFQIDNRLVFWDRVGNCPDNSYAQVLFGSNADDVRCYRSDSIAGPREECADARYRDLFYRILEHLDEPGLGLEPDHAVEEVKF